MDDEDLYSTENNSETETAPSMSTTPSVSTAPSASSANSLVRKKRRTAYTTLPNNTDTKSRSNRSHTTFFFRSDSKNSSIAYCKVCEVNLAGTRKAAYPYIRNGGNTTNLI